MGGWGVGAWVEARNPYSAHEVVALRVATCCGGGAIVYDKYPLRGIGGGPEGVQEGQMEERPGSSLAFGARDVGGAKNTHTPRGGGSGLRVAAAERSDFM